MPNTQKSMHDTRTLRTCGTSLSINVSLRAAQSSRQQFSRWVKLRSAASSGYGQNGTGGTDALAARALTTTECVDLRAHGSCTSQMWRPLRTRACLLSHFAQAQGPAAIRWCLSDRWRCCLYGGCAEGCPLRTTSSALVVRSCAVRQGLHVNPTLVAVRAATDCSSLASHAGLRFIMSLRSCPFITSSTSCLRAGVRRTEKGYAGICDHDSAGALLLLPT